MLTSRHGFIVLAFPLDDLERAGGAYLKAHTHAVAVDVAYQHRLALVVQLKGALIAGGRAKATAVTKVAIYLDDLPLCHPGLQSSICVLSLPAVLRRVTRRPSRAFRATRRDLATRSSARTLGLGIELGLRCRPYALLTLLPIFWSRSSGAARVEPLSPMTVFDPCHIPGPAGHILKRAKNHRMWRYDLQLLGEPRRGRWSSSGL